MAHPNDTGQIYAYERGFNEFNYARDKWEVSRRSGELLVNPNLVSHTIADFNALSVTCSSEVSFISFFGILRLRKSFIIFRRLGEIGAHYACGLQQAWILV